MQNLGGKQRALWGIGMFLCGCIQYIVRHPRDKDLGLGVPHLKSNHRKERLQKNVLMIGNLIIVKKLHLQKYKFVDFLYTNMKNFIQNPDYREVLTRTLHAFIDNFPRNTCRELNLVQCDVI